jgi:hypothetical protein
MKQQQLQEAAVLATRGLELRAVAAAGAVLAAQVLVLLQLMRTLERNPRYGGWRSSDLLIMLTACALAMLSSCLPAVASLHM